MQSKKKISVNLTPENWSKIQKIMKQTDMTQTEILNNAIAQIPILILGDRRLLAESFFELRKSLEDIDDEEIRKGVDTVCQSLNLLIEKLDEMKK